MSASPAFLIPILLLSFPSSSSGDSGSGAMDKSGGGGSGVGGKSANAVRMDKKLAKCITEFSALEIMLALMAKYRKQDVERETKALAKQGKHPE